MKRTGFLRRKPMRAKPTTGSGIRPDQRLEVALRDKGHCVRCGRSVMDFPASLHHRLLRSRGGSDNLANLVTLCGSGTTYCHGDVHAHPRQSTDDGFMCRTGEDPASVPVLTMDGWVTFSDDGGVVPVDGHGRVISGEVTW